MHAKAYELLNLSRGDVVGEDDKEAFCEEFGIDYEDEYEARAVARPARRRSGTRSSRRASGSSAPDATWPTGTTCLQVGRRGSPTPAGDRRQRPDRQQVHADVADRRRPCGRARRHPRLAHLQGRKRLDGLRRHARTGRPALAAPQRRLPHHRRVSGHHDAAVRRLRRVETPHGTGAHRWRRRPGRLRLAGRGPGPPARRGRHPGRGAAQLLPAPLAHPERRQPRGPPHRETSGERPQSAQGGRPRRGGPEPFDVRPLPERHADHRAVR